MKKLTIVLMCCLVLGGCGEKEPEVKETTIAQSETERKEKETTEKESRSGNIYETEKFITKMVGDIEYQVPKSWDDDSKISENNTYYYDDKMMVMVQESDFSYESFNERFNEMDEEEVRASVLDGIKQGFQDYEEISTTSEKVLDVTAFRFVGNAKLNDTNYFMDSFIFAYKNRTYSFGIMVESNSGLDYTEEFNTLIESISIIEKDDKDSNASIISQLKELYISEAQNKLPYSKEDSDSYFELVLKTSKELAKSGTGVSAEELANNQLFTAFSLAAGYLCNNYEEDTDYGKIGNMAFDLIGYIVADDIKNKDKVLNEFDIMAAKYDMTITTLDESNQALKESETLGEMQETQPIDLSTGKYIIGEDIPAGKYDIVGIEQGNVHVCSPGTDYGDIVNEIIKPGEITYANVQLVDGCTVEVVLGGKIQLQPK